MPACVGYRGLGKKWWHRVRPLIWSLGIKEGFLEEGATPLILMDEEFARQSLVCCGES